MLKSFFLSRHWLLWAWGGLALLSCSVIAQVQMLVLLNDWYGEIYDLFQEAPERDIAEFWELIKEFIKIAMTYVLIAAFSSFFAKHYAFRWRQAITFAYLPDWIVSNKKTEGAAQRLQEDTAMFAKILENLGLELFESVVKVIAFVGILWGLSEHVIVPYLSGISGSLVWVALIASIGGIIFSYFIGIKLPGLHYNNQRVEARFRKQLVYGEDDRSYANVPTLTEMFTGIRFNYFRLFLHYGYFDIWRISYLQMMILPPLVIMGPGLFAGTIKLGVLMKTLNAFDRVFDSFSYLIRSWTTIAELMSVIKRLREFQRNIGYPGKNEKDPSKIGELESANLTDQESGQDEVKT